MRNTPLLMCIPLCLKNIISHFLFFLNTFGLACRKFQLPVGIKTFTKNLSRRFIHFFLTNGWKPHKKVSNRKNGI